MLIIVPRDLRAAVVISLRTLDEATSIDDHLAIMDVAIVPELCSPRQGPSVGRLVRTLGFT